MDKNGNYDEEKAASSSRRRNSRASIGDDGTVDSGAGILGGVLRRRLSQGDESKSSANIIGMAGRGNDDGLDDDDDTTLSDDETKSSGILSGIGVSVGEGVSSGGGARAGATGGLEENLSAAMGYASSTSGRTHPSSATSSTVPTAPAAPVFGGGSGWESWDREEGHRALGRSYQRHANVLRDSDACSDHGMDEYEVDEFGLENSSSSGGSSEGGRSGSSGSRASGSRFRNTGLGRSTAHNRIQPPKDMMKNVRKKKSTAPAITSAKKGSTSRQVASSKERRKTDRMNKRPSGVGRENFLKKMNESDEVYLSSDSESGYPSGRYRKRKAGGGGGGGGSGISDDDSLSTNASFSVAKSNRRVRRRVQLQLMTVMACIVGSAVAYAAIYKDFQPVQFVKRTAREVSYSVQHLVTDLEHREKSQHIAGGTRPGEKRSIQVYGDHDGPELEIPEGDVLEFLEEQKKDGGRRPEEAASDILPPLDSYSTATDVTSSGIYIPPYTNDHYADVDEAREFLQNHNKKSVLNWILGSDNGKEETLTPVFWHVPKTGGGTMDNIMSHCLGLVTASGVGGTEGHEYETELEVYTYSDGARYVNVDTTTLPGLVRAKTLGLAESGLADVVASHRFNDLSSIFDMDHRGVVFALLRHPVKRAVSMFYYLKEATWEPTYDASLDSMTIEDYIKSGRAEENWMVRSLTNEVEDAITTQHVQVAKEIFKRKIVVGLTEVYEESVKNFQEFFGWPGRSSKRVLECVQQEIEYGINENAHPDVPPGTAQYQALANLNWADMELYYYAKNLFKDSGVDSV